ncbi:MAG: DNA polymerase I [Fusobacteriota bacterium]
MKKVVLLDTSAIMYKAYYSLMNMRNSKGRPTGAVYGFAKMYFNIIDQLEPDYVGACLDVKRSSLERREKYEGYKSQRKAMPDDLRDQVSKIKDLLDGLNIKMFEAIGHEADDVLGSLARQLSQVKKDGEEVEVYIVTGDKDLSQVLKDKVKIALLGKGQSTLKILSTEEDVEEQLLCKPGEIPDMFGLQGDSSDGIPGVYRIGPKTASKLIKKYGDLEGLYENIDDISGKRKEYLIRDKEKAFLSRDLATIKTDLELDYELEDLEHHEINREKLIDLFKELEFKSLLKKYDLGKDLKKDLEKIDLEILKDNSSLEKIENIDNFSIISNEAGIALVKETKVWYLPTNHAFLGATNLDKDKISDIFKEKNISGYKLKDMLNKGYSFKELDFDVYLAYYLLHSGESYDLDKIIFNTFGVSLKSYKDKFNKKSPENIMIEDMADFLSKRAYYLFKLKENLEKKLKEENLHDLFKDVEMKLLVVLSNMEINGIKLDIDYFEKFNLELEKKLKDIKEKIYDISDEKFNINSPQQLSEILFEKMGIKPVKKTKTGFSTNAKVMETLQKRGYEIADYVLSYRKYKKIKSTYVESLPNHVGKDGRIHTDFNQNGTSTGRLSSSNPNLQNIPTETEKGMEIREGFVAADGWSLLAADYSQIELRVLAEMSKDPELISAYENDLDLHSITAAKLFDKDPEDVTSSERDHAKVVNFSIVYGKTPYGLSKELDISVSEAATYIEKYFNQYSRVDEFITEIVKDAEEKGYVETMFGRKRQISSINSKNKNRKNQAERMAVNTVIQGTAADILKIVMVEIFEKIKDKDDIKMLLQVHDELIFEVKDEKLEEYSKLIKTTMENKVKLDNVKLVVEPKNGKNWSETK